MLNLIGQWGIIVFLALSSVAGIAELIQNKNLDAKLKIVDLVMFISGLSFITYFLMKDQFLLITGIASLVIILCAIVNGILRKNFHLSHHLVRIGLVIVLFVLSVI